MLWHVQVMSYVVWRQLKLVSWVSSLFLAILPRRPPEAEYQLLQLRFPSTYHALKTANHAAVS